MDQPPCPTVFEPPSGFESKFGGMGLVLPIFEGPLDLLLHLIREQKLDILDLPMASVIKQYMNYLLLMERLNLEIAAEFIAMAAQLIQIKSRMLLPAPLQDTQEDDPREGLVQKLREYEAIKGAAAALSEREEEWLGVVYTAALDIQEYSKTEEEPMRATVMDLLGAYREALKRLLPPAPVEVVAPPKTLDVRIAEVLLLLQGAGWSPFIDLLAGSRGRAELVLTFLALLELVKSGRARMVQTEAFGEIRVQVA